MDRKLEGSIDGERINAVPEKDIRMFINLSNHPHSGWLPEQLEAAEHYGEVVDLPFPQIPPQMTGEELDAEVARYFALVMNMIRDSKQGAEGIALPRQENGAQTLFCENNGREDGKDCFKTAVMLQGEMTFTFRLVTRLKAEGILCLAACSERKVEECISDSGEVRKVVVFEFAGFREY